MDRKKRSSERKYIAKKEIQYIQQPAIDQASLLCHNTCTWIEKCKHSKLYLISSLIIFNEPTWKYEDIYFTSTSQLNYFYRKCYITYEIVFVVFNMNIANYSM